MALKYLLSEIIFLMNELLYKKFTRSLIVKYLQTACMDTPYRECNLPLSFPLSNRNLSINGLFVPAARHHTANRYLSSLFRSRSAGSLNGVDLT